MRLALAHALSIVLTSVGCLGPEPRADDEAEAAPGSTGAAPGPSSSAGPGPSSSGGGGDDVTTSSSTSAASAGGDGGAGPTSSSSSAGPGAGGDGGSSASTGDGGATTGVGGGGGTGDGGEGGGGPLSHVLGGQLHFLQAGTVTLQNGADTLPVSANGAFSFAEELAPGASYDVTVASSPVGQTCWVQNGAGTAAADVTSVDVRCTTILQSKTAPGAANVSTTSASLVAIPNIAPITFTTDIAADVLATLLLPKLVNDLRFHVGLQLDGVTIGEASYIPRDGGAHLPGVVIKIQDVAPGTHTLVPVWSTTSGPLVEHSDSYTSEMNLVVLPSLPSFDRAITATLAANAGSTSIANSQATPLAMGFTPLSIDVVGAGQPTLISLFAADLAGDNYAARSSLDGQGFAGSVVSVDVNIRSFAPIGLTTLSPGNHTVDAEWFRFDVNGAAATRGGRGLPSYLAAALFKSGTPSAVGVQEGAMVKNLTSAFETVHPQLQVALNTTKPSKVLVTFHASNVRPTPNWPSIVDVAIFVNGAQGPTFDAFDSNNISWVCQGNSIAGVVDVPTGATTIDVRARNLQGANQLELGNMLVVGATRSILSAVVLD